MKKGIPQEGLKLIGCISMLIDHIGYALIFPMYTSAASIAGSTNLQQLYVLFRAIGRISLPIFAFLLVEGFHRTHSRGRYVLRLAAAAVLSELPYDLLVSGGVSFSEQSIMMTLLLGFIMLMVMEKCRTFAWKPVAVLPFALLGELLSVDYGWMGIVLIALFELSGYLYQRNRVRFFGMLVLFHMMPFRQLWIGNIAIPLQALGALSMLFISGYDGRKITKSKAVQWGFYLFYPVHLLILWAIRNQMACVWTWGIGVML